MLSIRAIAGNDEERCKELRNEWASVVDTGISPAKVREIVAQHQTAVEITKRNQRLGSIVEKVVWKAFSEEGFDVKPTGVGSDFKVWPAEAKDIEWDRQDVGQLPVMATYHGVPVEFLIEVKATRGDTVRMSWRQGQAAAEQPRSYVLCVVDFSQHIDLFDLVMEDDDPTVDLVAGCISLVSDIGETLSVSVHNLNTAVETENPDIEVERAEEIRFRISRDLWREASTMSAWATAVRGAIVNAQAVASTDSN
jgi:hypothetical protein